VIGLFTFIILAMATIFLGLNRPWRWLAVAPLIFLTLITPLIGKSLAVSPPLQADDSALWQNFDTKRIASLVAEGKTVLIDVTADWCITCKVNKAVALENAQVITRLKDGKTIALRADWTKPNPEISAYLQSFGRYGIPFNAAYGPNAPQGLAMPELLTPSIVLEYLDKAGKK
jgi:suppressor for copper-sensitivity B